MEFFTENLAKIFANNTAVVNNINDYDFKYYNKENSLTIDENNNSLEKVIIKHKTNNKKVAIIFDNELSIEQKIIILELMLKKLE